MIFPVSQCTEAIFVDTSVKSLVPSSGLCEFGEEGELMGYALKTVPTTFSYNSKAEISA